MTGDIIEYQAFPRAFGLGGQINPQTASANLGDLSVEGYSLLAIVVDVTIVGAGGGNLTVNIQELDEASGKYITISTPSAARTTTGTDRAVVNPLTSKKIRVQWTITAATPFTFTVSYKLKT